MAEQVANYQEPWKTNSALTLGVPSQLYTGGPNGTVNPGDYTNSGYDFNTSGIDSMFDMPTLDQFQMGIGGVNSIMGALGTWDMMKNNKLQRQGMEQNQQHARMAREDRTNFLSDSKSAFA